MTIVEGLVPIGNIMFLAFCAIYGTATISSRKKTREFNRIRNNLTQPYSRFVSENDLDDATRLKDAADGIMQKISYLDRLADLRMFGSIGRILSMKISSNARAARLLAKGLQEYSELVGEVIVEMAFDNMLTLDPNARPLGGSSTFIMAMTLSVVTMGVMSSMGSRGLKMIDGKPRLARSMSGALRLSLMALSTGLALSQLVMRMPVYMSVMA